MTDPTSVSPQASPVRLTRRALLRSLAAVAAVAPAGADSHSTFQGIEINHIALRVNSVERSREFYQRLLGAPTIIYERPDQSFVRVGRNFIALFERGEAAMDHFAISVENYEPGAAKKQLDDLGLKPRRSQDWVYFHDPEGHEVQVAHAEHEFQAPLVRPAPDSATFRAAGLNHVALRVREIAPARDFYQGHFGMPVLRQSSGQCFLGLRRNFVALFQSNASGMDHFCVEIEDYEVGAVKAKLQNLGLNPSHPEGTDRVYFKDPDGLTVQLSEPGHPPEQVTWPGA